MQIILHIGQQKTASTAIQSRLAHNRPQLASQGVLHPAAFGEGKTHVSRFVTNRKAMHAPRETIVADLRAEISGSYGKVVLSDENLFPGESKKNKALALKRIFEEYATSWRVLCYVRRPDEHIVSQYQQKMRKIDGRSHGPFEDFFAERLRGDYYRYAQHLDRWAEVFGQGAVEVRVFHRKTLQGSPVEDFVRWIGVDPQSLSSDGDEYVNESLDRTGTEILRFLYRCQVERPDLLDGHDLAQVRRSLKALATSDRLRLDTERAKRLQERFRKDHERLAARYLSPEHAAILLAPPAETPPQPPLEPETVFERMMAVFADPEFARLAATEVTRPEPARPAAALRGALAHAASLPRIVMAFLEQARRRGRG